MSDSTSTQQLRHWLSRCREGDPRAREELLAHLRGRLNILVRRVRRDNLDFVRPQLDTDDATQEVYVKLLQRWEALLTQLPTASESDSIRWFLAALSRMIRDVLCDAARAKLGRGREPRAAVRSLDQAVPADAGSSAGFDPGSDTHDPDRLQLWADFHRCLEELPTPIREVADLRWYHELEHAEIADVLGIAEVTSRVRWTQARHILRERFPDAPFEWCA